MTKTQSDTRARPEPGLRRECFLTIGATASFSSLLTAALSSSFINTLHNHNYTHLTIQYGPSQAHYTAQLASLEAALASEVFSKIVISGFDFNTKGLGQEMRRCKAMPGKCLEGVVVCHAGAGTILDGMRIGVPMVVVPNPELLDDHQTELAIELEKQGYVTHGRLNNLDAAIVKSEKKSLSKMTWPPGDSVKRGIMDIVDDELGYEAAMREILD